MAESDLMEQGATIMPIVSNDPLAMEAPMLAGGWTTVASASTSFAEYGVSCAMVARPAGLRIRWVSMLLSSARVSRMRMP